MSSLGCTAYKTVAAGQTQQRLTKAAGTHLRRLIIQPATTSPGAVTLYCGADSASSAVNTISAPAANIQTIVTADAIFRSYDVGRSLVIAGDSDPVAVTSISVPDGANKQTIVLDAAYFVAADVGEDIIILGDTDPNNDGTFMITDFVSSTSVKYVNAPGSATAVSPANANIERNNEGTFTIASYISSTSVTFTNAPGLESINSPGTVNVLRKATVYTFPGGALSVEDCKPIVENIDAGCTMVNGATEGWHITTGANVSVVAICQEF